MNKRENLLSLYRRTGYETAPCEFLLCPDLVAEYKRQTGGELPYSDYFGFSQEAISELTVQNPGTDQFLKYHAELLPGTIIDEFGVAHEPGSAAAKHMTRMRHPLKNAQTLAEIQEYPYPVYTDENFETQRQQAAALHARGLAATGSMQCTIWEKAWYIRGMEELMMDMMSDDPMAEYLLDRITDLSITRAKSYAKAGCDLLFLGDDIGMQHSIMMSETLYCDWLKPRLKKVIDAARAINPDIIVLYHSCGYVEPFIPHLIDVGVDVLNPVQPECMDFQKIHAQYGDRLSFNGVIGTQTTMPFGTPDDVRRAVFESLEIAGDKGGLLACPTHLLEPEVPWENIEAYVKACEDFK